MIADEPKNPVHGAAYWRCRAMQARTFADEIIDADARDAMENLAALCDAMATRSERQQRLGQDGLRSAF